jgi:hypothetical protein
VSERTVAGTRPGPLWRSTAKPRRADFSRQPRLIATATVPRSSERGSQHSASGCISARKASRSARFQASTKPGATTAVHASASPRSDHGAVRGSDARDDRRAFRPLRGRRASAPARRSGVPARPAAGGPAARRHARVAPRTLAHEQRGDHCGGNRQHAESDQHQHRRQEAPACGLRRLSHEAHVDRSSARHRCRSPWAPASSHSCRSAPDEPLPVGKARALCLGGGGAFSPAAAASTSSGDRAPCGGPPSAAAKSR